MATVSQTWESAKAIVEDLKKGELEAAQNKAVELRQIRNTTSKIKKPHTLIYIPLIYLAVCADALGIVFFFIAFTGVGAIVAAIISACISIFFFSISLWLNHKIKNVRVSGETVANYALQAERRIQFYRTQVAQAIRLTRRTAAGRSILRSSVGRKTVKLVAKFGKKSSPIGRAIFSTVAEIIPFLQLVPWYTINIYLTYKEHKNEYAQSLFAITDYSQTSQQEPLAFSEFQEAQALAATEELEDMAEEEYPQAA